MLLRLILNSQNPSKLKEKSSDFLTWFSSRQPKIREICFKFSNAICSSQLNLTNLPTDDRQPVGQYLKTDPKNDSSTRFLLLADLTECIIEALCQSSCCRQCMINWALGRPGQDELTPTLGSLLEPPKPTSLAKFGPKFYRFGLWDPDLVQGNDIYKYLRAI